MTSIRKFWWAGLALAVFVGCAEETTTTPSTPPAGPGGPAASTPPPGGPAGEVKDAPKPEMKDAEKPEAKDAEKPAETPPKVDAPKIDAPKIDAPKAEPDKKAASVKLNDDQIAEIKKLPADDQVVALKQIVCPVSDEPLGDMGTPIKVTAEGKSFFICCKSCKKEVDANAKAVLAKLKN